MTRLRNITLGVFFTLCVFVPVYASAHQDGELVPSTVDIVKAQVVEILKQE